MYIIEKFGVRTTNYCYISKQNKKPVPGKSGMGPWGYSPHLAYGQSALILLTPLVWGELIA